MPMNGHIFSANLNSKGFSGKGHFIDIFQHYSLQDIYIIFIYYYIIQIYFKEKPQSGTYLYFCLLFPFHALNVTSVNLYERQHFPMFFSFPVKKPLILFPFLVNYLSNKMAPQHCHFSQYMLMNLNVIGVFLFKSIQLLKLYI